jgi:hypothetical protein
VAAKSENKTRRDKTYEWRYVYLTIAGKKFDPEMFTKKLGILPDNRGKLGEPHGKNKKRKQGYWSLEGGPSNWRIETQMKHILSKIRPVRNKLKQLIKEDKTIKRAYLTLSFETPRGIANACYCFDSKLINEFTSLGIDIALSIYIAEEIERIMSRKTDS